MSGIKIFWYNIFLYLLLPLALPAAFLKNVIKKRPSRLNFFPGDSTAVRLGRFYWIQAASAGEVILAETLIAALKEETGPANWLIYTTTNSGYAMAREKLKNKAELIYLPWDYAFLIRKLIKVFPPRCLFILEADFWPNLIYLLKKAGNPKIIVLNGRVNDRAWRRYRRMRYFIKEAVRGVDFFCMQTSSDAAKMTGLGAAEAKMAVTGNAKFDREFPALTEEDRDSLRRELRIDADQRIIIAGSTHEGEEEIILEALAIIRETYDNVILILAPRHLERIKKVETLLERNQIGYQARSRINAGLAKEVIVLDTMGELSKFYNLAYLSIVGGSFTAIGGHNLLEPVAQGSPVLYGPYIQNFKEIAELLSRNGVGVMAHNSRDLAEKCLNLLNNPQLREELGLKAQSLVAANRGAKTRMLEVIKQLMNYG